jgi:predicted GTPase
MSWLSSWLWTPKSARILVLGRVNSGKSALINAMLGDRKAAEGEALFYCPITTKVQSHEFTLRGVPVTVFDTPGLRGAETETEATPSNSNIKEILKASGEVDLVVFCCRLDQSIAGIDIDYEIILQLKANLSSSTWKNVVFALTFANKVEKNSDESISKRIYSFGQRLCECVSRSGVDLQVASAIPFIPAAYGKDDKLLDHENWYENFWDVCIPRMKDQPKTTTLKSTISAASPLAIPSYLKEWLSQTSSASILITGKTGTGKSSLINGIVGKIVAKEGHKLERETTSVQGFRVACEGGVTITVWDSPGLQDGLDKEGDYIKDMQSKGLASADLVFYCQKMNETRMVLDDSKAIRKLTNGLGESFWSNTVFVLTFANETHPPPNQKYRSLSEKEKVKRNLEFFNDRLEEWRKHLQKAVIDAGIKPDIAEKIPVVAAGYEADQSLPGCDNWLSNLWVTSIERMKENSQPALLKANLQRLKNHDQAKPEDLSKPLHEQPIFYKPVVRYGTAPLVITALGIIVGGTVAGPVGIAAAGVAGAGAGGLINSIIAWVQWYRKPAVTSETSSDSDKQDKETASEKK